jgi:hypothetical protein
MQKIPVSHKASSILSKKKKVSIIKDKWTHYIAICEDRYGNKSNE